MQEAVGGRDSVSLTAGNGAVLATAVNKMYGTGTGVNTGTVNYASNAAGGSSPVSLIQPYLAINFIIAMEGNYPSRN